MKGRSAAVSRTIVCSRSEPVEMIAAGTPLVFSSQRNVVAALRAADRRSRSRRASALSIPAASRTPARTPRAARCRRASPVSVSPPAAVRRADLQLIETVEHVKLRDRERVEAVDARGVAHRDGVVPAAAARPAGRRRRTPGLFHAAARPSSPVELGRQRAFADARRVRLRHAKHDADRTAARCQGPWPRRRRSRSTT